MNLLVLVILVIQEEVIVEEIKINSVVQIKNVGKHIDGCLGIVKEIKDDKYKVYIYFPKEIDKFPFQVYYILEKNNIIHIGEAVLKPK